MNLCKLSASGMAMLLTTAGLPPAGTSLASPTVAQTVRITDSMIEVTGRAGNGTIRIINRPGPRHRDAQQNQERWTQRQRTQQQQTHQQQTHQQQTQSSQSSSQAQVNQTNEPYQLTVETTGRSLNADLKIDGRTVKKLVNPSETIALSPYLSTVGQHTIEVVGNYSPVTASTQVLLIGPGTHMSQQVSGNGTLHQTLRISVQ